MHQDEASQSCSARRVKSTGGYFEPSVPMEVGSVQQFLGGPQSVSRPGRFLGHYVCVELLRVDKQQFKNKL